MDRMDSAIYGFLDVMYTKKFLFHWRVFLCPPYCTYSDRLAIHASIDDGINPSHHSRHSNSQ